MPVADALGELARAMRRSRARLVASARHNPESAEQLLLRTIASHGPMRASAIAESVHLDLSTVSRQTSDLVARGILERGADPGDGRACLLTLTRIGRDRLLEHELNRERFFSHVLADWPDERLETFADLIATFTAAYERTNADWSNTSGAEAPSEHASKGRPA
jgi:DNA-binding MarR family transcriptional regulator